LAVASDNTVYIGDVGAYRVRRVDPHTGVITTVVGTGEEGNTGDGGPGPSAQIEALSALAIDAQDRLLLCHDGVATQDTVRRYDPADGVVTTVVPPGSVPVQAVSGMSATSDGRMLLTDNFGRKV
jgi:serine/threonine-protein kinase